MLEDAAGLLYMKVGTHAQEELSDIIARKKREIETAGMAMWGYGGNTCHPSTMVQPFARSLATSGRIVLCMQPMTSNHFAEQVRAREFSTDGLHWEEVPQDINVLGSRYALCVTNLVEVDAELDLSRTRVALGNSKGRPGDEYIRGRVDKACLELVKADVEVPSPVHIELVAEIVEPFAVFLRS